MECQQKVIENQQQILNLAENPFKNQTKRKVWKCQILQKPQNLAENPFKNQAKRKVWKSQILRKPPNLAGNPK